MKKILNSRFGETIILTVLSIVNLIFTFFYYSFYFPNAFYGEVTMWTAEALYFSSYRIRHFNVIFIALFLIGLILFVISALMAFIKNKKRLFFVSVPYNLVLSVIVLFLHLVGNFLDDGAVLCALVSIFVSAVMMVFIMVRRKSIAPRKSDETVQDATEQPVEITPRNAKALKTGMIVCQCLSTVIYLLAFVIPVYSIKENGTFVSSYESYYLMQALGIGNKSPMQINIAFMIMSVACFAGILYFTTTVFYFSQDNRTFAIKSQKYMYVATLLSGLFFIVGYSMTFFLNIKGGSDEEGYYSAVTFSYLPAILSVMVLVLFSVFQGRFSKGQKLSIALDNGAKFKVEPLIYVAVITAITFVSLALNLITVEMSYGFQQGLQWSGNMSLSGYQLLKDYPVLEGGFQLVAFLLVTVLVVSGAMLVMVVVSYFAKNKDYYKIIKTSAFTNFVFTLMIGLFGLYFKIVQKINEENILSFIQQLDPGVGSLDYVNEVSSQSYFAAIASFAILIVMLVRGQFNLSVAPSDVSADVTLKGDERKSRSGLSDAVGTNALPSSSTPEDFDACPAFTELDTKINQFAVELSKRNENLFENPTLPNLVRFVVDYARDCRLHLSYSLEDIATFVAGLGASRLSILQGMSGTGKTSLPKIFTEALMGTCEIVEVESSWRDKNELLGYYNEFSKCYTPKKFTQALYKARLNSAVPTFIVLDEMNLSRIEYYFSDFLSLMENEEDKREIKLLNIKLSHAVDGEMVDYCGLTDGHTIKIPSNVWFVGTANRDESTFEISDKVYDRAQTMNFNKRAPKVHSFSEPLPQRFVSYEMIAKLLEDAKQQYDFDAEQNRIVQNVEKLLLPYNISFGNRILKQMEDFVKIYCACFGDKSAVEDDAVEKILLSKVVSKLENKIVENKQALVTEFNKLGLSRCSAFIQKLNED